MVRFVLIRLSLLPIWFSETCSVPPYTYKYLLTYILSLERSRIRLCTFREIVLSLEQPYIP